MWLILSYSQKSEIISLHYFSLDEYNFDHMYEKNGLLNKNDSDDSRLYEN